jgi:hypothetical protein
MRLPLFLTAALATLVLAGCGGKGTVSGQVRYNGQPLPSGDVAFLSEAGDKPVLHAMIQDGQYSVSGLPAGPAQITVTTTAPAAPVKLPPGVKQVEPAGGAPAETPAPGKYVHIPPRYGRPDQSGLSYPVKRGSQTYDIDLTP